MNTNDARISGASPSQLQQTKEVITTVYTWSSLIAGLASVALLVISAAQQPTTVDVKKEDAA